MDDDQNALLAGLMSGSTPPKQFDETTKEILRAESVKLDLTMKVKRIVDGWGQLTAEQKEAGYVNAEGLMLKEDLKEIAVVVDLVTQPVWESVDAIVAAVEKMQASRRLWL